MAGVNSLSNLLPPPSTGKLLTVLSIDGGGIKGVIPAVILQYLERELKRLEKDDSVRIADYFDVIAGTSTGGLIATMLAAPNNNHNNPRPKYTADDIRNFYFNDGPKIFPPGTNTNPLKPGPKYDGKCLRNILETELGPTVLNQTRTNVVIPTFDINRFAPTIFSSYKVEQAPYLNAHLSDICLATSAAPTYLPAINFKVAGHDFNMVDGGVSAGNPTLVALSELGQEKEKHPKKYPMMKEPDDYSNVLLVSLGCGILPPGTTPGFTADEVNKWSLLGWIYDLWTNRMPLIELASSGNQNTMDYYIYGLFKASKAEDNFLRVQADNLTPDMSAMDDASETNLNKLESKTKDTLKGPVKRVNPITFELEPIGDGTTYEQALTKVAKTLIQEKKNRMASKN